MAGDKISGLLICSIFLLLAGEFARDATKVWEYIFSEVLYLSSTAVLLTVFLVCLLRSGTIGRLTTLFSYEKSRRLILLRQLELSSAPHGRYGKCDR